jgi:hypothetical protein
MYFGSILSLLIYIGWIAFTGGNGVINSDLFFMIRCL